MLTTILIPRGSANHSNPLAGKIPRVAKGQTRLSMHKDKKTVNILTFVCKSVLLREDKESKSTVPVFPVLRRKDYPVTVICE